MPFPKPLLNRTLPVLLAVLCTAILPGCGRKPEADTGPVIRPVKLVTLRSGGLQRMIELPGQIQPLQQANMAFEVPGVMTEILVEEGQMVHTGQLLARLDPRDYEAIRTSAEAQLEAARIEAERAQALFDRKATSKQRLDIAVSKFKVAEAEYERADKAYEDTKLIAPIDGIVARKLVEDVVNVQAKQVILIIQDNSKLKAVVNIPENIGMYARRGLNNEERTTRIHPEVMLSFRPDLSFPAKFSEVSMMADTTTRTYEATLVFDPPKEIMVLPGMTAKVRAKVPEDVEEASDRFAVPVHAVGYDDQGAAYVWKVKADDMSVTKVQVTTHNVAGDSIEVSAPGLENGDQVATSGVHYLTEGMTVRPFTL